MCLTAFTNAAVAQAPPNRAAEQAQRRIAPGNLVGHGGPVKAIAVSSDGTRALTGSFDYSAILWDLTVEPPKQLLRLDDHSGAVNAVAFVPSTNRALTAGDDSIVRLWDLDTARLVHKFEGHDAGSKIVGLAVGVDGHGLPTGDALSSGWDRTVRVWNLTTLTAGAVLRDHTGPVNTATFSGDGRVAYTASADGRIRAFDVASGAKQRDVYNAGHGINVLIRLASSTNDPQRIVGGYIDVKDDHLLFGALSGSSGVVDGLSGALLRAFADAQRPVLSLADGSHMRRHSVARPGTIAIASGDGRIRIFNYEDGQLLHEYKSAFGPVWALALRRNEKGDATALYYGGLDDFATYWPFAPRAPFEAVDTSQYPRRFQQSAATADTPLAKGELQFARKCSICHTLTPDGANRAGPTLHNIFGRRIATLPGYNFSPELKQLDIVWNAETISKLFELGPDKFTPGSKMPLQVMSEKTERDDLITFLQAATK